MEIDETVICRPKYNRGKMMAEQRWYFGGIERMTGRCFMKEVEKIIMTSMSRSFEVSNKHINNDTELSVIY